MDQFIVVKLPWNDGSMYLGEIDLFAAAEDHPSLDPDDANSATAKWSKYPLDALRWQNQAEAIHVATRVKGIVLIVPDPFADYSIKRQQVR